MWKSWKEKNIHQKLLIAGSAALLACELIMLLTFVILYMDNLMHSDMSAEVLLSKLLSDENKLVSSSWYYSTEIRIVYTQLIMVPLFKLFHSYRLVKQLSVVISLGILIASFVYLTKRFTKKPHVILFGLALLLAPISNEYLDMELIGNFYTAQTVCTFLVLAFLTKAVKGQKRAKLHMALAFVWGIIMGLSGLRYLASLYIPMVIAAGAVCIEQKGILEDLKKDFKVALRKCWQVCYAFVAFLGSAVGLLIHKTYIAKHFSFDQSPVSFVSLDEIPERFLASLKLMLAFVGYREAEVMTGTGIVTALGIVFLVFLVIVVSMLFRERAKLATQERVLLYFFLATFALNWFLLVCTNVLLQYRYWLPVYIIAIVMIAIAMQHKELWHLFYLHIFTMLLVFVVLGSLYAELWADMHYNDCEKRYEYMSFLEQNDYDFGYASFWNASVSEYLSNGEIKFASLGLSDFTKPYDWLLPKEYYRKGFHKGKCFLLLANTEAAGMDKGDFVIMEDATKVYEDAYYTIYEGNENMYIFDEE